MLRPGFRSGGRASPAAGAACVLAVVLTACGAGTTSADGGSQAGSPAEPAAAPVAPGATRSPAATSPNDRAALPRAASPNSGAAGLPPPAPRDQPDGTAPVSVTIPALGIRSPLVRLGLTPDGALGVPSDFGRAGWYTGGPPPGQPGPSVIAGHVDSRRGPAVFYRLRDLRAGDEIHVQRRDRTTVTFAVTELRQYAKTAFPTREVYGPVPQAELRLITCAGVFDAEQSSYRSNLVVFAELVSLDPTAPRSR